MINESTIIHLVKQLDVTDLSGEKVMIDFETGKYFLLKGAANEIWDMLSEDISVADIKKNLLTIYEVDEETCLNSVLEFLEQMKKNQFIELK